MNVSLNKRRKLNAPEIKPKVGSVTNTLGTAVTRTIATKTTATGKTTTITTKAEASMTMAATTVHKKPRITPAQAKLNARVDKLFEIHKQIAADVENRLIFMDLTYHNGRYCVTCSPTGNGSTCGSTCPILRPGHGNGLMFQFDQQWWDKSVVIAKQHADVLEILASYTPDQIGSYRLDQYEAIAADACRFGLPVTHDIQDHETRQKMRFNNPFDNNKPC